jgi:hypothetical protein
MVTKENINKAYDEIAKYLANGFLINEYEQECINRFQDTILQYAIENYLNKYLYNFGSIMRIDDICVTEISVINFHGLLVSDYGTFSNLEIHCSIFSLIDNNNNNNNGKYFRLSTKEEFDKMLNGIAKIIDI